MVNLVLIPILFNLSFSNLSNLLLSSLQLSIWTESEELTMLFRLTLNYCLLWSCACFCYCSFFIMSWLYNMSINKWFFIWLFTLSRFSLSLSSLRLILINTSYCLRLYLSSTVTDLFQGPWRTFWSSLLWDCMHSFNYFLILFFSP